MPSKPPTHKPRGTRTRKEQDAAYRQHRKTDTTRAAVDKLRDCKRWRDVRRLYLDRVGWICESCRAHGLTRAAQQVHHVRPLEGHPELAYDLDNLQALCVPCHNRAHGKAAL